MVHVHTAHDPSRIIISCHHFREYACYLINFLHVLQDQDLLQMLAALGPPPHGCSETQHKVG